MNHATNGRLIPAGIICSRADEANHCLYSPLINTSFNHIKYMKMGPNMLECYVSYYFYYYLVIY